MLPESTARHLYDVLIAPKIRTPYTSLAATPFLEPCAGEASACSTHRVLDHGGSCL